MSPSDRPPSLGPPRPRILVVAPEPYYEDRGTPIAVAKVLEALSELGYDVDILTYPVGVDLAPDGVRIYRCANPFGFESVPIGLSLRKLALDLGLTAALRRRLRTDDYGCVHAVEEAAFPAIVLAGRRGIPVIYDMQSSLPEQLGELPVLGSRLVQRALRAAERWLLSRADYVVSSTGLAYRVGELAPATGRAEWRFPHAVREVGEDEVAALRAKLDIAPEAPVVLYSGNFAAYQGIELLLSAFASVRASHPKAVLVLVGAPDARRAAEARDAAAPELAEALRVVPRQPRDRMDVYHRMAGVFVSPRLSGSNLPLKVLDYLAAGGAIVATDIAAHRTVLDESNAVLVAPDAASLGDGIDRALADDLLRSELGEAAGAYARRHLGWGTFVEALEAVYRQVLSPPTPGRPGARTEARARARSEPR